MATIRLDVPVYSYSKLRKQADLFLARYNPTAAIPVTIEEIAEFSLELNIIPIPGLQAAFEVEGFMSSDFLSISVDQWIMERRERRYRFTLAHEIAHLRLHQEIFEKLKFKTTEEWKTFQRDVNAEDYGWLEWQAYAFAGLVLAPREALASRLATCETEVTLPGTPLKVSGSRPS